MNKLIEPYKTRVELWLSKVSEYERCCNRLRKGGCYCFLGIGCDLSGLGEWQCKDEQWFYVIDGDHSNAMMPFEVIDYYGMNRHSYQLAILSDEYGFKECIETVRDCDKLFKKKVLV